MTDHLLPNVIEQMQREGIDGITAAELEVENASNCAGRMALAKGHTGRRASRAIKSK